MSWIIRFQNDPEAGAMVRAVATLSHHPEVYYFGEVVRPEASVRREGDTDRTRYIEVGLVNEEEGPQEEWLRDFLEGAEQLQGRDSRDVPQLSMPASYRRPSMLAMLWAGVTPEIQRSIDLLEAEFQAATSVIARASEISDQQTADFWAHVRGEENPAGEAVMNQIRELVQTVQAEDAARQPPGVTLPGSGQLNIGTAAAVASLVEHNENRRYPRSPDDFRNMTDPVRRTIDYQSSGQRTFLVETLAQEEHENELQRAVLGMEEYGELSRVVRQGNIPAVSMGAAVEDPRRVAGPVGMFRPQAVTATALAAWMGVAPEEPETETEAAPVTRPSQLALDNETRQRLVSAALATTEGRSALAASMVAPIRRRLDMAGMARNYFPVQGLPDGTIPSFASGATEVDEELAAAFAHEAPSGPPAWVTPGAKCKNKETGQEQYVGIVNYPADGVGLLPTQEVLVVDHPKNKGGCWFSVEGFLSEYEEVIPPLISIWERVLENEEG